MTIGSELQSLKRRLSPLLLRIPGVSGVGIPGGTLTVYLTDDSAQVRDTVSAVLRREAPGAMVDYVVTGPFRRQ